MRPMCPGCFYSSLISNTENSLQGEKVGHLGHVGHVIECYRADQSADRIDQDWSASEMILRPAAHLRVDHYSELRNQSVNPSAFSGTYFCNGRFDAESTSTTNRLTAN